MDPQSLSFTPQNDLWKLSNTVKVVQDIQQEHSDRLSRLERRQDEDARVKLAWSHSSFPGALGSTPQPGSSLHNMPTDFASFDDDQSNNMMRSLQLDADEEPRRTGATSRANSVRFDDSANQAQWNNATRSSTDLFPKFAGGIGSMGGHGLFERSTSHKSDGRHSSAGHSAVSGRANSLRLDTPEELNQESTETPVLAPGLFILGSVPTIIRCWLTQDFRHESLLYAAVCTGSYTSVIDFAAVKSLGLTNLIHQDINSCRRIKLSVYLPEAVPLPSSSRTNSPAPQLPSVIVDFTVVEGNDCASPEKAIKVFLGSDTLRAHRADVLLSTNQLILYDDENCKSSVPFVRPESEDSFKSLCVTTVAPSSNRSSRRMYHETPHTKQQSPTEANANGVADPSLGRAEQDHHRRQSESREEPTHHTALDIELDGPGGHQSHTGDSMEATHRQKPSLTSLTTWKNESKEVTEQSPTTQSSSRGASSPAIWGNWRREVNGSQPANNDWAHLSRTSSSNFSRPNRDQGMKVLRPSRQSSRSSGLPLSASASSTSQSKFCDEVKRRNDSTGGHFGGSGSESGDSSSQLKRSASMEINNRLNMRETNASSGKNRSANPIGGASAFGWLNSGQVK